MNEPKAPKRQKYNHFVTLYSGESLRVIKEKLGTYYGIDLDFVKNINLEDLIINHKYDRYDGCDMEVVIPYPEPLKDFARRQVAYKNKLEKYNKWKVEFKKENETMDN